MQVGSFSFFLLAIYDLNTTRIRIHRAKNDEGQNCKASLTFCHRTNKVTRATVHNHILTKIAIDVQKEVRAMKEAAKDTETTILDIYEEAERRLLAKGYTAAQIAESFVAFDSIRTTLYTIRSKVYPKLPTSLAQMAELDIPLDYSTTIDGQPWHLFCCMITFRTMLM